MTNFFSKIFLKRPFLSPNEENKEFVTTCNIRGKKGHKVFMRHPKGSWGQNCAPVCRTPWNPAPLVPVPLSSLPAARTRHGPHSHSQASINTSSDPGLGLCTRDIALRDGLCSTSPSSSCSALN